MRDTGATEIGNNSPNISLECGRLIGPEETIHTAADLDIKVKRSRHYGLEWSTETVKIDTVLVKVRIIDGVDG